MPAAVYASQRSMVLAFVAVAATKAAPPSGSSYIVNPTFRSDIDSGVYNTLGEAGESCTSACARTVLGASCLNDERREELSTFSP